MANQGEQPKRRLLKFVLGVPLAVFGIAVFYAFISLTDGSFASLSVPVETAMILGLLVVIGLVYWLITHRSASRNRRDTTAHASTLDGVRAPSWPLGRLTPDAATVAPPPSAPILPRPTIVRSDPTVPVPATLRRASTPSGSTGTRREPGILPAETLPTSTREWGASGASVGGEPRRVLPGAPPKVSAAAAPAPVAPAPVAPAPTAAPKAAPAPTPVAPAPPVVSVAPPVPEAEHTPPRVQEPPVESTIAPQDASAGTREDQEREKDAATAAQSSGQSNALTEYLAGRAALAKLIENVETRRLIEIEPVPVEPDLPLTHETRVEREAQGAKTRAEPEPVVVPAAQAEPEPEPVVVPAAQAEPEPEPEPVVVPAAQAEPEPEPVAAPEPERAAAPDDAIESTPSADAAVATEANPSELLAQNTLVLTQAVEEVARASELIARACELFTERVESDRLERRALADAVMTLARQAAASQPPASAPPRLVGGSVFATSVWQDEIVIEDDRPDRSDAPGSTPVERSGSGAARTAPAAPRQSTWSGGS